MFDAISPIYMSIYRHCDKGSLQNIIMEQGQGQFRRDVECHTWFCRSGRENMGQEKPGREALQVIYTERF